MATHYHKVEKFECIEGGGISMSEMSEMSEI